jgi:hypothetical protein
VAIELIEPVANCFLQSVAVTYDGELCIKKQKHYVAEAPSRHGVLTSSKNQGQLATRQRKAGHIPKFPELGPDVLFKEADRADPQSYGATLVFIRGMDM